MTVFTDALLKEAVKPRWRGSMLANLAMERGEPHDRNRALLDRWLGNYPSGQKLEQIRRDVLSFDNPHHIGGLFELFGFHLLRKLGLKITPNNARGEAYPDYFLEIDGSEVCLEVTTKQPSKKETKIHNSVVALWRNIEKLDKPFVMLLQVKKADRPIRSKDLKRLVSQVDCSLLAHGPLITLQATGFEAELRVDAPSSTGTSIALLDKVMGSSSTDQQEAVAEILRAKARRHREVHPEKSLIVLLGFENLGYSDFTGQWRGFNALLGPENFYIGVDGQGRPIQNSARTGIDTQHGLTTPTRRKDGSVDPPKYNEISGVIDVERFSGLTGWRFDVEYTPNVWADSVLMSVHPQIPSRIKEVSRDEIGRIVSVELQDVTPYQTDLAL